MVDAILIIAAGLGAAFLLGLLNERWRVAAYVLTLATLAFMTWVSASWLWAFAIEGADPVDIFTAGTPPPFAINLHIGLAESALLLLVNLSGLLSALYLRHTLMRLGRRAMAVLMIFVMALGGIILTRDIFNLFVFFELMVIATGGLILLSEDDRALAPASST
jgi:formate hydrogenlyase subunit 3/multisubunit Na+/H+ antiporter MnhD subunit